MRRRTPPSGSLVSLLDVLFILVFASLVQSQARGAVSAAAAPPPAPPPPGTPLVTAPPVPAPFADLRKAAVSAAARHVEGAPLVVARIAADGTLLELELAGEHRPLGIPLLERVIDRDIGLSYIGERAPAMRVCGVVARELRLGELTGYVVVIAPAAAVAELPVALVAGLRRDVNRCQAEQRAMAVIVEPEAPSAPPAPPAPPAPAGGVP